MKTGLRYLLAVVFMCAAGCNPPTSQPSQDNVISPGNDRAKAKSDDWGRTYPKADIGGIRLGMTEQEAVAALRAWADGVEPQPIDTWPSVKSDFEGQARAKAGRGPEPKPDRVPGYIVKRGVEMLSFNLTGTRDEPRVYLVDLSRPDFHQYKPLPLSEAEAFEKAVEGKYGKPTRRFGEGQTWQALYCLGDAFKEDWSLDQQLCDADPSLKATAWGWARLDASAMMGRRFELDLQQRASEIAAQEPVQSKL